MTDEALRGKTPCGTPEATAPVAPIRTRSRWQVVVTGLFVTYATLLHARASAQEPPGPLEPRLRQVVKDLTAPEFAGRSGAGGQKAAAYLVDRFRALKLEPLFDGDFQQAVPGKEPGTVIGHNVGARLIGSDPVRKNEWVILAAHFDHLGMRNGRLYPGADDNASGVAMMLETARIFTTAPQPPKRSLMFIGFDLEENALWGSRFFVAHPPVPLDRVVLFVTADMISRSLAGVGESHVFVFGSEHAPGLRPGSRNPRAGELWTSTCWVPTCWS